MKINLERLEKSLINKYGLIYKLFNDLKEFFYHYINDASSVSMSSYVYGPTFYLFNYILENMHLHKSPQSTNDLLKKKISTPSTRKV